MLETLRTLCSLSGVSGDEGEVREYILNRVRPYADSVTTDTMGNLIVFKKGAKETGKTVMLSAHMDEVGVMVTNITDDGYIKFAAVGGIDRRVLIGKTVFLGKNKVFGVIGCKAVHLVKGDEKKKVPEISDMYIDIGVYSREDAEKYVSIGDTGAFDNKTSIFGNGFLRAKAIDDRAGCAVLIKLIESELPIDCHFVFAVQEEVGCRGAFGAAFRIKPDIALVVEGTTAADLPTVDENKRICVSGDGVVIPFMDRGAIYDKELYRGLTQTAEKCCIPWQTKTYIAGGTDAQAIQRSRTGVKTAGIAVATRNIHSPSCTAKISDIEGMLSLAKNFLYELGELD